MKALLEKQRELISNLTLQLVAPEPTTYETDENYSQLCLTETRLRDELTILEQQESGKEYYEREFVEWIIFSDDSPFWYEKHTGKNMYWREETDTYHTIEELYQYWQSIKH